MPYVDSDGVRLYYEVIGHGPPVVLHHGTTQTLKRWHAAGYVAALSERYELILMDPRGNGASDKPHDSAAYTLELRVADVLNVADAVGRERFTFWGYSDGGRAGFGLAKYAPERLDGLIIGGHPPCAYAAPTELRVKSTDDSAEFMAKLRKVVCSTQPLTAAREQEWLENDIAAIAAALHDEVSLEDILPDMRMPCLMYAGEKDMFFSEVHRCVQAIANVQYFSLPDVGHPGAFWQSQRVLPHAIAFLDSLHARRPASADPAVLSHASRT